MLIGILLEIEMTVREYTVAENTVIINGYTYLIYVALWPFCCTKQQNVKKKPNMYKWLFCLFIKCPFQIFKHVTKKTNDIGGLAGQ